ncbi:hypothetical protein [Candidatus Hodarchaeum mangrovi]
MAKEYPQVLKYVFLIHFFIATIFGLGYLLIPDIVLDFLEWPIEDYYVVRVLGAAFIGIALSSILGYRESGWSNVKITVQMELVWLILGIFGSLWTVIGSVNYPIFGLIAPLLLLGFLIGFGYSYYLMEFKK